MGGSGGSSTGGTGGSGTGGSVAMCDAPAWVPGKTGGNNMPAYADDDVVSYQGKEYSPIGDMDYAHESCPPDGSGAAWCADSAYRYEEIGPC
jgi:hypothetical protein